MIQKLSDGPALPLFFLLYWAQGNPAPFSFAIYVSFWVIYHELGIKQIFHRSRPVTSNGQKGFSFPSSHSFASGIIIVMCLIFPMSWKILLIVLSIINTVNRPAVGVHYIADVIAGFSLGIIVALGWPFILGIAKVALP